MDHSTRGSEDPPVSVEYPMETLFDEIFGITKATDIIFRALQYTDVKTLRVTRRSASSAVLKQSGFIKWTKFVVTERCLKTNVLENLTFSPTSVTVKRFIGLREDALPGMAMLNKLSGAANLCIFEPKNVTRTDGGCDWTRIDVFPPLEQILTSAQEIRKLTMAVPEDHLCLNVKRFIPSYQSCKTLPSETVNVDELWLEGCICLADPSLRMIRGVRHLDSTLEAEDFLEFDSGDGPIGSCFHTLSTVIGLNRFSLQTIDESLFQTLGGECVITAFSLHKAKFPMLKKLIVAVNGINEELLQFLRGHCSQLLHLQFMLLDGAVPSTALEMLKNLPFKELLNFQCQGFVQNASPKTREDSVEPFPALKMPRVKEFIVQLDDFDDIPDLLSSIRFLPPTLEKLIISPTFGRIRPSLFRHANGSSAFPALNVVQLAEHSPKLLKRDEDMLRHVLPALGPLCFGWGKQ